MITKTKNLIHFIVEKLSIQLFSIYDYSLNLYQVVLSVIVLLSGIFIIKFIIKKINQWKFLVDLDGQHQSIPIVKLLRLILFILLFLFVFSLLGFPAYIFLKIWNHSLFQLGDNSISLGNLIFGIIFFFFAFRLNKLFRPKTDSYIDQMFKLDFSTRHTVMTIIEYFVLFLILLFSLSIIGIPLTAFTFIGGTLAIGIGFGSQNLINNFISGFVLMGERTTKIGDIIEIEGNTGTVEKIGFRSTVIKTFNNLRLIIPNSSLLENNVINWSLTDKVLRRKITVGVAYGSDAEKVLDLLVNCTKSHSEINTSPEPFVIFSDFGDSALIFDIYFFIEMGKGHNPLRIESELRTVIYKELEKENITIPFPQQDVFLHPTKPLDINIRKDGDDIN